MTHAPDILLIEDDEDDYLITRSLLAEIYGASDFEITWVNSHNHVIDKLNSNVFDVILCDNLLDGKTGIELISEISQKIYDHPPIILLTGAHSENVDNRASAAGAFDYLVKQDLTPSVLERSIRFATRRRDDERQLLKMAHYDNLTGCANRTLFNISLSENIRQAKRAGNRLALILLDLDFFKEINDTMGHPAGDQLLIGISNRINENIRESDLLARLGGDEFALLATQISDSTNISHFIDSLMEKTKKPFELRGKSVSIGVSAGVSIYPTNGSSPEELIDKADLALYQAKNNGRSQYQFYTETNSDSLPCNQQTDSTLSHPR